MIHQHRTAFKTKENQKSPVEDNVSKVIQQINLKMKEFIVKKRDIDEKTQLLNGQNEQYAINIEYLHKSMKNKIETIERTEEELNKELLKIEALSQETGKFKEDYLKQSEDSKETINKINATLNKIQYTTLSSTSIKNAKIKQKLEDLVKIKEENILLAKKWVERNSELFRLKNILKQEEEKQDKNIIRVANGISEIEEMFINGMKLKIDSEENKIKEQEQNQESSQNQ